MAIEGTLDNIFVGTDHAVIYTNYADPSPLTLAAAIAASSATIVEMAGWTVVLDIRKSDTSTTSLLSKTGVISGTFNATPGSNTQVCTFTLSDDDLSDSVFAGDDKQLRYSIKRTDAGFETVLRFGTITLNRVTQV